MHSRTQIKVIKKNAVKIYKTPEVAKESSARQVKREIVSTVSGWVSEFQMRRNETKPTLEYLFAQN